MNQLDGFSPMELDAVVPDDDDDDYSWNLPRQQRRRQRRRFQKTKPWIWAVVIVLILSLVGWLLVVFRKGSETLWEDVTHPEELGEWSKNQDSGGLAPTDTILTHTGLSPAPSLPPVPNLKITEAPTTPPHSTLVPTATPTDPPTTAKSLRPSIVPTIEDSMIAETTQKQANQSSLDAVNASVIVETDGGNLSNSTITDTPPTKKNEWNVTGNNNLVNETTTGESSPSSSSSNITNNSTTSIPQPPMAHRDSERFVTLGVSPPQWDPAIPRQSAHSPNPLMDPPETIPDPYGWLRDEQRSDPQVLEYLLLENNYTGAVTQPMQVLQNEIYQELTSYTVETSHSFPLLDRDYFYYRRTVKGSSYPLHCRAPKRMNDDDDDGGTTSSSGGNETATLSSTGKYIQHHLAAWNGSISSPVLPGEYVYLDENTLADGHEFMEIGDLEISPSQTIMAFTVDFVGNELYQLVVQDIASGNILFQGGSDLMIREELLWGTTDDILFYIKADEAQRSYQAYQWDVRTHTETLLYQEDDILYWVGIDKTNDEKYLLVDTSSAEESETRYLDLRSNNSSPNLQMVQGRQSNVLYAVDHFRGTWWILSTADSDVDDFQLWTATVGNSTWTRVREPHSESPLLDGIALGSLTVFEGGIIVRGRDEGMPQIWMIHVDETSRVRNCTKLEWNEEPAHDVDFAYGQYSDPTIMLEYESFVTPRQVVEISLTEIEKRQVLYETPVPGYDRKLFGGQRLEVTARDGKTKIPVSLVYLKSTMDKANVVGKHVPLHLYSYGAYGSNIDDDFSISRLPLLQRGAIFAVAHVRGGGEMGRSWYEDGKLLNKKHTFEDFIDVARFFVDEKQWTTSEILSCEGRSAGGLTIGASLNQAPELFRVAILGVPFVDIVATMSDASIPLTAGEWEEWGNPNEAEYFRYMLDYSPMNTVRQTVYPSMLLMAGLFDPRVAYWEPAKFTATLRYTVHHSKGVICLKTDMSSGHFRASDRYHQLHQKAFESAFLLSQVSD